MQLVLLILYICILNFHLKSRDSEYNSCAAHHPSITKTYYVKIVKVVYLSIGFTENRKSRGQYILLNIVLRRESYRRIIQYDLDSEKYTNMSCGIKKKYA